MRQDTLLFQSRHRQALAGLTSPRHVDWRATSQLSGTANPKLLARGEETDFQLLSRRGRAYSLSDSKQIEKGKGSGFKSSLLSNYPCLVSISPPRSPWPRNRKNTRKSRVWTDEKSRRTDEITQSPILVELFSFWSLTLLTCKMGTMFMHTELWGLNKMLQVRFLTTKLAANELAAWLWPLRSSWSHDFLFKKIFLKRCRNKIELGRSFCCLSVYTIPN